MTEDFLHFIWKFSLFSTTELTTVSGEQITILNTGIHNTNAGPDFLDAHLKIGDKEWLGHVEIHLRSSDWFRHKHQEDAAYKNVILHAVFDDDKEVFLVRLGDLQVFDLSKFIRLEYIDKYESLQRSRGWIPCVSQINNTEEFHWFNWLDRLVVERLERKSARILDVFEQCRNDWSETLYRVMASNFGFKVNSDAFQLLAESLPMRVCAKHRDSIFQMEALLYGQAGLLDENFQDKYPNELVNEFAFLKHKYTLHPMKKSVWKNLRLMPNNFPVIRIAQFAHLLVQSRNLFSKLIESDSVNEIKNLLNVHASEYWDKHTGFDKESRKRIKNLGVTSMENIIINTVVPFLFVYGRYKKEQAPIDKALSLLESCKPENNTITRNWKKLDKKLESALHSQASLELKNEYCTKKKCLSCVIGIRILKEK